MLLIALFCSCSFSDDNPSISVFTASFDFSQAQGAWQGDFSDLPANEDDSTFYELKVAYTDLPSNLGSKKSMMLSGNNHSDDLFMFMKRKITGLIPNTCYTLVFEIELASDAAKGSVGVGGLPRGKRLSKSRRQRDRTDQACTKQSICAKRRQR